MTATYDGAVAAIQRQLKSNFSVVPVSFQNEQPPAEPWPPADGSPPASPPADGSAPIMPPAAPPAGGADIGMAEAAGGFAMGESPIKVRG